MEGWTDPGALGVLVTRKAGTWVRIPETEGMSSADEVEVSKSAETQDCTTKPLAQKYWEEEEHGNLEELAYVPSAADEPRCAIHMCDNKCRAKGVMFHELAPVVTIEGGSPQTINLCRNCCNKRLLERRKAIGTWVAVEGNEGKEVSRGKLLLASGRMTSSARCGSDSL